MLGVALVMACGDRGTLVETHAPAVSTQPLARPAAPVPWVPAAPVVAAFAGPANLYQPLFGMHGSLFSRYMLYEDSTFSLQFESVAFGPFEYPGKFTRTDTLITFAFFAASTAGRWEAKGVLKGNALSVQYNLIMAMSDFIDGVYVRQ
jgi:hypothetical protein